MSDDGQGKAKDDPTSQDAMALVRALLEDAFGGLTIEGKPVRFALVCWGEGLTDPHAVNYLSNCPYDDRLEAVRAFDEMLNRWQG